MLSALNRIHYNNFPPHLISLKIKIKPSNNNHQLNWVNGTKRMAKRITSLSPFILVSLIKTCWQSEGTRTSKFLSCSIIITGFSMSRFHLNPTTRARKGTKGQNTGHRKQWRHSWNQSIKRKNERQLWCKLTYLANWTAKTCNQGQRIWWVGGLVAIPQHSPVVGRGNYSNDGSLCVCPRTALSLFRCLCSKSGSFPSQLWAAIFCDGI